MSDCDYGKCGMRIQFELDDQTMEVISHDIGKRGHHSYGYYCDACGWKAQCNPTPPYVLLDDVRCCLDAHSLRYDVVRYLNFLFSELERFDCLSCSSFLQDFHRLEYVLGFLYVVNLLSKRVYDDFMKVANDLYDRFLHLEEERSEEDESRG